MKRIRGVKDSSSKDSLIPYCHPLSQSKDPTGSQDFMGRVLNDISIPGDYDGDGKTNSTVYRPGEYAYWYVLRSLGSIDAVQWGSSALNDVPAPAKS